MGIGLVFLIYLKARLSIEHDDSAIVQTQIYSLIILTKT